MSHTKPADDAANKRPHTRCCYSSYSSKLLVVPYWLGSEPEAAVIMVLNGQLDESLLRSSYRSLYSTIMYITIVAVTRVNAVDVGL